MDGWKGLSSSVREPYFIVRALCLKLFPLQAFKGVYLQADFIYFNRFQRFLVQRCPVSHRACSVTQGLHGSEVYVQLIFWFVLWV